MIFSVEKEGYEISYRVQLSGDPFNKGLDQKEFTNTYTSPPTLALVFRVGLKSPSNDIG